MWKGKRNKKKETQEAWSRHRWPGQPHQTQAFRGRIVRFAIWRWRMWPHRRIAMWAHLPLRVYSIVVEGDQTPAMHPEMSRWYQSIGVWCQKENVLCPRLLSRVKGYPWRHEYHHPTDTAGVRTQGCFNWAWPLWRRHRSRWMQMASRWRCSCTLLTCNHSCLAPQQVGSSTVPWRGYSHSSSPRHYDFRTAPFGHIIFLDGGAQVDAWIMVLRIGTFRNSIKFYYKQNFRRKLHVDFLRNLWQICHKIVNMWQTCDKPCASYCTTSNCCNTCTWFSFDIPLARCKILIKKNKRFIIQKPQKVVGWFETVVTWICDISIVNSNEQHCSMTRSEPGP